MLSYQDVVGLRELTEKKVAAITPHERIPSIVAAELGNYMVHENEDILRMCRIIIEDLAEAAKCGDHDAVLK